MTMQLTYSVGLSLPVPVTPVPFPFSGGCLMSNGKILLAPGEHRYIGIYDPIQNTYIDGPEKPNISRFQNAVEMPNGKILLNGDSFILGIYDPIQNTYTNDGVNHDVNFYGTIVMQNGKILLISDNNVVIYDPTLNTYVNGASWSSYGDLSAYLSSGVEMADGRICLIFYVFDYILIYDPLEDIITEGPYCGGGGDINIYRSSHFYKGFLAENGKIYLVPYDRVNSDGKTCIGIYDPVLNTFSEGVEVTSVEVTSGEPGPTTGEPSVVSLPNNKFFIRFNLCNSIIYDASNDTIAGEVSTGNLDEYRGGCYIDNKIILFPLRAYGTPNIGIVTYTELDIPDPDQETIKYIKSTATGTNDGTSWSNAFTSLQIAIDASNSGDSLWVAAGTYSQSSYLSLKSGVSIYGGFAGSETELSARDPSINETYINGATAYLIKSISSIDNSALLDGFIISNSVGIGLYNGGSPTISNCTFINNVNSGISNVNGSPLIHSCIFKNNKARTGAAILNNNTTPTITNCTFYGNIATVEGGAIANYSSNAIIINCTFNENRAYNIGGGVHCYLSYPVIKNCIFWENYPLEKAQVSLVESAYNMSYCIVDPSGYNEILTHHPKVLSTIVNRIADDPGLINPADNDGFTQTQAYANASIVEAIPESVNDNWNGCPAVDQRGVARSSDGNRAIGSYEGEVVAVSNNKILILPNIRASSGQNLEKFIAIYDCITDSYRDGPSVSSKSFVSGILTTDDKVILLPWFDLSGGYYNQFGIYDLNTDTYTESNITNSPNGSSQIDAGVAFTGGRILLFSTSVIDSSYWTTLYVYNHVSDLYCNMALPSIFGKIIKGITISDDKIVLIPKYRTTIGIYNSANNTYHDALTLPSSYSPSGYQNAHLIPDGRIVIVRSEYTQDHTILQIAIYDHINNTYSEALNIEGVPDLAGTTHSAVDFNGNVILLSSTNRIIVYDPISNIYRYGPVVGNSNNTYGWQFHKIVAIQDGRMILIPGQEHPYFGIYDPSTDIYTDGTFIENFYPEKFQDVTSNFEDVIYI